MISEGGADAYYKGPIADAIVAYSQSVGGLFSKEDFARHTATWVDPVSTNYRGYDVWELPPNGQGIAALQMLNLMEPYDLHAMGPQSAEWLHILIEAKKLAYEDRAKYYADPEFVKVPVSRADLEGLCEGARPAPRPESRDRPPDRGRAEAGRHDLHDGHRRRL